jgi:hypothetical protein
MEQLVFLPWLILWFILQLTPVEVSSEQQSHLTLPLAITKEAR